ncbi:hypothetical protein [Streptomyces incanus]|uniref:Transposase n=1 Tax=Streptomyces incanus TaxID=887453 RepID=A0ABW0XXW1_9ACTN
MRSAADVLGVRERAVWRWLAAAERDESAARAPGERAGLAGGEWAARKHDVFLVRPRGWRNQVGETDEVIRDSAWAV